MSLHAAATAAAKQTVGALSRRLRKVYTASVWRKRGCDAACAKTGDRLRGWTSTENMRGKPVRGKSTDAKASISKVQSLRLCL